LIPKEKIFTQFGAKSGCEIRDLQPRVRFYGEPAQQSMINGLFEVQILEQKAQFCGENKMKIAAVYHFDLNYTRRAGCIA
jgi:hypothetical protein